MSRRKLFLSIALLTAIAANSARLARGERPAPPAPADPIEWVAPDRSPEFREVIKEADYKPLFEKEAARIDIGSLKKGIQAAAGMRIDYVIPGSQAERQGVHQGELLTEVDGLQIWGKVHRSSDQNQIFTLLRKDGSRHDATVEPGLFGVDFRFVWHPEFEYLSSKSRHPWDKETLVGMWLRNTNPDLAETALHHAVADGLVQDQLIDGVGAEIALEQGRNEAAMDFVWDALVSNKTDRPMQFSPIILYRAAIANYKLDVAAEILSGFRSVADADPAMLRRLAKMHRARPKAQRRQPDPEQLAAGMRRVDLAARMSPADRRTRGLFKNLLLSKAGWFDFNAQDGFMETATYTPKPAVRDIEVSARFTARADNPKDTYGRGVILFGLWDLSKSREALRSGEAANEPENERHLLFGIESMTPDGTHGTIFMTHGGSPDTMFEFEEPRIVLNGSKVIELKLLRIGGQAEIFVDGRRVLYVPFDPDLADLSVQFKTMGMLTHFKEAHISELLPRTENANAAVPLPPGKP